MASNKHRKKKFTPSREELKKAIIEKMKDLLLWEDSMIEQIPPCWDNFDNFIIFSSKYFTSDRWSKAGPRLWEQISNLFCGKSIALQGKINNDDYRSPNARVVFGPSQWVTLLDNGIWFTWNVEYTMFCTGNVSERHRIASFTCEGETIVDMFAGIGYFTLPYLVRGKAKHVFACEWNPKSVEALNLNLTRNKVTDRCTVLEGDVNLKAPRAVADRINLGLIPSCEQYWPTAAEVLKPSGGNLHVHGNVSSFSSGHNALSECEVCIRLLQSLSVGLDTTEPSVLRGLGGFEVDSVLKRDVQIKWTSRASDESNMNWKKIEWFIWSIHTCHSFCSLLTKVTNSHWVVKPTSLHRVKAYAPHIDHLVLDINCQNSVLTVL
ncbi:tRNA wybutosine-synthesizing protein 2 homolog isoform X1 [Macrosteles quadrilineatus]|uniref:tRNA wybutosine-synthesizing protein 2 homolog isoform X1 n=1 Tax=Macrosteles quadrilineatus TaxID=74068 RepID=UPI0023E322E6|nr:tRNA wybutosine-synthesizing protein 2 homolog isoform X1 [Macrosteles quadrilineatus]